MEREGTKIYVLSRNNWITWRHLLLALLKYPDLQQHLHEEGNVPADEHQDEAKATFMIKKNISPEVSNILPNLTRPSKVWAGLRGHFGFTNKRNIQTAERSLREITIESCSFDISTNLQKKRPMPLML